MHRDGRSIDVVARRRRPIFGADGTVVGTMVTIADLTQRKQAEAALRESESQLRLAMDAAQMGMWYWETRHRPLHVLRRPQRALRRAPPTSRSSTTVTCASAMHPDDRELVDATLRHAIKAGRGLPASTSAWSGPTAPCTGSPTAARCIAAPTGARTALIGVAMDITERKLAEQRIAHMAHHDALTGLPNRVLLRDRIQQAIAQAHRNGTQLAVLFLDLDRFKTINDSLGHQLGDRLLQSVASRILVCVREGDTVSRVGGDEFVIVIPGIGAASPTRPRVAAKILEVLARAFHLHGNDLHVSASIGISLYPADGADAETLMRNADTAMYHAKDAGRGNFQFFTQHMNVAAQQRLLLENALRRALETREFELHYQPLYDLRDRSITGFEALLRWNPPERRPVAAGRVHRRGRGVGPDRADRRVGAARGAAPARSPGRAAGRAAARSRSTSRPTSSRARASSSGCAASLEETGIDPRAGRARSDRGRDHRGRGGGARGARPARGPRRGHRHRRLRHRLLGPRVPEAPADRHGEDRPVVRARPHRRPRRRGDRHRDRRHGARASAWTWWPRASRPRSSSRS